MEAVVAALMLELLSGVPISNKLSVIRVICETLLWAKPSLIVKVFHDTQLSIETLSP